MKIDMNDLLESYRLYTSNMTQEKYEYLKSSEWLSPVKKVKLSILKKNGASDELLARAEYAYLFETYANHFYRWWKDHEWGDRENESLADFAEGALVQAVLEEKEKKADKSRQ